MKVIQAVDQTRKTLDYLNNLEGDFGLLYNLTGNKNYDHMNTGGVIILDGFLPTLFSGNERADRTLGLDEIHDHIFDDERIVVITLYDLYQLIQQQEIDLFNEFLQWRTGYRGNIPVWGYSEREYWAFYFDNYRNDDEFQSGVELAAEKEIITIYISARFNDKPYFQ